MSNKLEFIILDEFLINKSGHYYEYDRNVLKLMKESGYSTRIFSDMNTEIDVKEELNCEPLFRRKQDFNILGIKSLSLIISRVYFWIHRYRELRQIARGSLSEEAVFFMPNIFWYNILPVTLAFRRSPKRLLLLFRTSPIDVIDLPRQLSFLPSLLFRISMKLIERNNHIGYLTDSEVIKFDFEKLFPKTMVVLPIPHLFEKIVWSKNSEFPMTLFLPGNARIEKGIETIVGALETINQSYPDYVSKIEIIVQFTGASNEGDIENFKKRLNKLKCLKNYLGKLTTLEYQNYFSKSDVILVPYLTEFGYRARTSGVLAEAISSAIPFITTKGTWMEIQALNYRCGICIHNRNVPELANAIIDLILDYGRYKGNMVKAQSMWNEFHSVDNFKNILCKSIQELNEMFKI